MNQVNPHPPVPRWFTIAAIAALLFELGGCAMYLLQLLNDPTLADEIALYRATPLWVTAAFAVAVWVGLAGAVLLLLRRRQAAPLLLVSLAALLIQISAYFVVPALRNLTQSDDLFLPFVIVVISYSIWHFAWKARRSGWLR